MKEKGKKERRTEDRTAFSQESCHIHVFRDALQTPRIFASDNRHPRPQTQVQCAGSNKERMKRKKKDDK